MPRGAQHLPGAADLGSERGADLRVRQCSGCGLVQLDSAPVPYFRDVIRAAAVSEEMAAFRRAQFDDFVRRHALRGKKVVEIGCGRGEYLTLLRNCGVEAHGLEAAPAAAAHCRSTGLTVAKGFVKSRAYRIPGAPFDAFLMLNYLEHLPAPNTVFAGIRANLREGGLGLVEVPNFDMIVRRELFSEFIPDHLTYFTAATFRSTLEINGFEVLECREVWHDYILSAVVRRRGSVDLTALERRQEGLTRDISAFLDRHPAGRVAVWGAGHQALALLSLAGMTGRVRYVVDSAPFKQGCFTPATHLPIVAPGQLDIDPVDAVIVMAASYSDEVTAGLRARHGDRIEIAVVRNSNLEVAQRGAGATASHE